MEAWFLDDFGMVLFCFGVIVSLREAWWSSVAVLLFQVASVLLEVFV